MIEKFIDSFLFSVFMRLNLKLEGNLRTIPLIEIKETRKLRVIAAFSIEYTQVAGPMRR